MDLQQLFDTPWMLWALVASAVTVAAYVVSFMGTRSVSADIFTTQINKLLRAHNPARAVRLCKAVVKTRLARLTLFMLGQEIPARSSAPGDAARGYREAAGAPDFAEVLRARVSEEQARLRRTAHRLHALALVLMLAALATSVVALTHYLVGITPQHVLQWWPFVVTVASLLGVLRLVFNWRKELAALELTVSVVLPLLQPAEEMDEDWKEAAAKARKSLDGRAR
jgi:hypothetical protein